MNIAITQSQYSESINFVMWDLITLCTHTPHRYFIYKFYVNFTLHQVVSP